MMKTTELITKALTASEQTHARYADLSKTIWNVSSIAFKATEYRDVLNEYLRRRRTRYSIQVSMEDPFFNSIQVWLMKNKAANESQKRFKFASVISRRPEDKLRPDDTTVDIDMFVIPNFKNESTFELEGHKIHVYSSDSDEIHGAGMVQQTTTGAGRDKYQQEMSLNGAIQTQMRAMAARINPSLVFCAKDKAGIEAVERLFRTLVQEDMKKDRYQPRTYTLARWGSFEQVVAEVGRRKTESIFLDDGVMDDIIGDISEFLAGEQRYKEMDIPYHRGYLLYGPPGTGKTSIVKAVASHFNMDLYIANLTSGKLDNDGFDGIISDVKPHSILVIEDIDTLASAQDSTDKESDKTTENLMSLLNGLDGLLTPRGVIVFLTTNFKDKLDPRLIRPGRIDRVFEIGYMGNSAYRRMIDYYYGALAANEVTSDLTDKNITPAEVSEIFKVNMNNGHTAVFEAEKFVAGREPVTNVS
jgi:hypothetical protein